jgi:hypothetical protein
MFRVPAVTIFSTAVGSHWYNIHALDREMYGRVHFKGCPEWMVVTSLWLSDVTTIHSRQTLKLTLQYISRSIAYVIPMTASCSIIPLMMGTAGTRSM